MRLKSGSIRILKILNNTFIKTGPFLFGNILLLLAPGTKLLHFCKKYCFPKLYWASASLLLEINYWDAEPGPHVLSLLEKNAGTQNLSPCPTNQRGAGTVKLSRRFNVLKLCHLLR